MTTATIETNDTTETKALPSADVQRELDETTERLADIRAQITEAQAVLLTEQKLLAKGNGSTKKTSDAQARVTALQGVEKLIDDDIDRLHFEYQLHIEAELKDDQLAQLKALTERANGTLQEYGVVQIQSVQAFEFGAKSLLETFRRYNEAHKAALKFLNAPETVVSLNDLDINTDGVAKTLPHFAAPLNGETTPGEDGKYIQSLFYLMEFVANTPNLRPCPDAPGAPAS